MKTTTCFVVWRRSDGYVSASIYRPREYTDGTGFRWSYEVLLETADWPEARTRLEQEYKADPGEQSSRPQE